LRLFLLQLSARSGDGTSRLPEATIEKPWKCQKIGVNFDHLSAVHVLIAIYLIFVGILALLAQMVLPGVFPLLNLVGFGSALVPLVVIYASLELGDERAPIIAAILGLLLDLTSHSHRLGTSVLVLFSLSSLIVTQAGKPESHTFLFRLVYVLVGTFAFFVLTYVLILAESARWYWPFAVWNKITFASLLNVLIAPIFFYVIGFLPRAFGWKPSHEQKDRYYDR
jgi:rod shape-determining protein MreD